MAGSLVAESPANPIRMPSVFVAHRRRRWTPQNRLISGYGIETGETVLGHYGMRRTWTKTPSKHAGFGGALHVLRKNCITSKGFSRDFQGILSALEKVYICLQRYRKHLQPPLRLPKNKTTNALET